MPTTIGSSGYIFVVRSCFLSIFYEWFLPASKFFLSQQQWSSHENGQNSAHRLSFASRPTPPPCQQQEAAADTSLWCVLVSFQFFTNLFLATSKIFLSHQQWSSHMNGRNSAHRLSFASRPTPPPCQQHHAAAGTSLRCILVSFHFFTNDLLHI